MLDRSSIPASPGVWAARAAASALLAASVLGIADLVRLDAERRRLEDEVFRRARQNESLRREILTFLGSNRALEILARRDLGFVRDGDLVYRFPPAFERSNSR